MGIGCEANRPWNLETRPSSQWADSGIFNILKRPNDSIYHLVCVLSVLEYGRRVYAYV